MHFASMRHNIFFATSNIRAENPHSLSYQPNTRTSACAITCTCGAAITKLSGRALRSDDTNGRSVIPSIPGHAERKYSIRAGKRIGRFGQLARQIHSRNSRSWYPHSTALNSSHKLGQNHVNQCRRRCGSGDHG